MSCPRCAAALAPSILELIGGYMIVPFVVFAVAALLIQRVLAATSVASRDTRDRAL
jgi:hypothetical protein